MARKPREMERAEAGAKSSDDVPEQGAAPQTGTAPAERADEDAIRRRAYQIWEEEGWPQGREQEHWLKAQRELAEGAGPGPKPAAQEDRSRAVAPPKARKRPGASAKLGGTPGAPATRGRGRGDTG